MQVTVKAPAKINLTLDVVGVREDGYHLLESVMQTVSVYDTLTATVAPAGVIALDTGAESPCPVEKNTAYRAAQVFFRDTGIAGGVTMTLAKVIPQQAGMGGGSADAAAVLWALDRLYDTHLSVEQLIAMGVQIGADVPLCIAGGTNLCEGIGERLTRLPALPDCCIAVVKPAAGVSTAEAYAAIDRAQGLCRADHAALLAALEAGDLPGICRQTGNMFQQAIALPEVAAIRRDMAAFGPLCSCMTGSGSAVFGIFSQEAAANACVAALGQQYPTAFVCKPCAGVLVE